MALSLTPLQLDAIPTSPSSPSYDSFKSSILSSSTLLLSSLSSAPTSWTSGKPYNAKTSPTSTFKTSAPPGSGSLPPGVSWHARISRHDEKWDKFKQGLMVDHSLHEKEYVESCAESKLIQVIEPGVLEIWQTRYHLPFPTTNRDFVFLLLTVEIPEPFESSEKRAFQVISIPVDHPEALVEKGWVRGKYVAVEQVVEDADAVIWRMATASDAGGSIPRFITELAMPGKIAEDVPSFVGWLGKR